MRRHVEPARLGSALYLYSCARSNSWTHASSARAARSRRCGCCGSSRLCSAGRAAARTSTRSMPPSSCATRRILRGCAPPRMQAGAAVSRRAHIMQNKGRAALILFTAWSYTQAHDCSLPYSPRLHRANVQLHAVCCRSRSCTSGTSRRRRCRATRRQWLATSCGRGSCCAASRSPCARASVLVLYNQIHAS